MQHNAGNRAVNELLESGADNQSHAVANVPPIVESALRISGQPLDSPARSSMESLFGEDFGQVRVHTDGQAAESARSVEALAYTAGQDVVFGAGQYQPETAEGRKLLAHELGHTIEQRESGVTSAPAAQAGPTILRAPLPGAAEGISLFSSKIPAPTVTRIGSSIVATVYFDQNFFLLDSRNLAAVEKLGEELRLMVNPMVGVDGHASTEGTEQHNLNLSENRRQTVIALLRSKLIGAATFSGKAHGESEPAVEETVKGGAELEYQRALNRRVTIVVLSTSTTAPKLVLGGDTQKPIDINIPPHPETPDERKKREEEEHRRRDEQMFKPGDIKPRPQTSFSEEFWKVVDKAVDDVSRKVGVPEKYRDTVRDGAHALIEKGAEKAFDYAMSEAKLSDDQKKMIKAAINAAAQTKGSK